MPAPQVSPEPGTRVYQGRDAERRLWDLCRVQPAAFANAAQHGNDRTGQLLEVHPRTFRGQVMWGETTAGLRLQLFDLQQDWEIGRDNGYETVVHRRRKIAIVIVSGDSFTGVPGAYHPKARRPRGPMTVERISRNKDQLAIEIEGLVVPEDISESDLMTWFFLIHARKEGIFSELSHPIDPGTDGRIGRWSERILFEPLNVDGAVTPISPGDEPDDTPVVVVDRKS